MFVEPDEFTYQQSLEGTVEANTIDASVHIPPPYSAVGQPLHQWSISAPGLPHTHERSRLNLTNLEMDDNRDEVSDVEDTEDPMDVLKCCEDSIWEASPFRNPRHHEKIR